MDIIPSFDFDCFIRKDVVTSTKENVAWQIRIFSLGKYAVQWCSFKAFKGIATFQSIATPVSSIHVKYNKFSKKIIVKNPRKCLGHVDFIFVTHSYGAMTVCDTLCASFLSKR